MQREPWARRRRDMRKPALASPAAVVPFSRVVGFLGTESHLDNRTEFAGRTQFVPGIPFWCHSFETSAVCVCSTLAAADGAFTGWGGGGRKTLDRGSPGTPLLKRFLTALPGSAKGGLLPSGAGATVWGGGLPFRRPGTLELYVCAKLRWRLRWESSRAARGQRNKTTGEQTRE